MPLHAAGYGVVRTTGMALMVAAAVVAGTVVLPCVLAFLIGPFRERCYSQLPDVEH